MGSNRYHKSVQALIRGPDAAAEDGTADLFNLGWTLRRSHQILTLPWTLRQVGVRVRVLRVRVRVRVRVRLRIRLRVRVQLGSGLGLCLHRSGHGNL